GSRRFRTAKRCQIPAQGREALRAHPVLPRRTIDLHPEGVPEVLAPLRGAILGGLSIHRVRCATLCWDLAPLRGAKPEIRPVSALRNRVLGSGTASRCKTKPRQTAVIGTASRWYKEKTPLMGAASHL